MIKIGIIGCGSMGSFHTRVLMDMKDKVEITAIADVCPEKIEEFCKELNAKQYGDGKDLINNENVDAVFIFLPTYLHAEYAIFAMKKGIDVFVEKPLCLNEEECQLLIEAEKRTGRKLMVGHVVRFCKQWVELKKIADSKEYGEILHANFERLSPRPQASFENWMNNPEKSGGVGLDLHIHDIDYMRYLMGEPKSIHPRATYNENKDIEYISTVYDYGNAYATISASWDTAYEVPFTVRFRVEFEKATVILENWKFSVYEKGGGKKDYSFELRKIESKSASDINISVVNGYDDEDEYFIDCVTNNQPIEKCTVADAEESVKLARKELSILREM